LEERTFKKDTNPYLIFCCSKCNQYSYVKTTQKTKKCLRCGYTHQVKNILNKGEIVYGVSTALRTLKMRQNKLVLNETDGSICFKSNIDFTLPLNNIQKTEVSAHNDNYSEIFYALLKDLFRSYKIFPRYIMEIMAENYGIPTNEVNLLIREFRNKGILTLFKKNSYYYTLTLG
jgi:ribosomal protein L30E